MEEARRIAQEPVEFLYGKYIAGYRGRGIFANRGETLSSDDEALSWFDFLAARDHLLIGTPEVVAEQIARLRDETGMDDLATLMWLPGVDHRDIMRSIELFGERVIPLVEEARGAAAVS
jgi:alkanesulfonate monooxygenase SsuD/methylene tetrahydromethanopterin reductase-like flavin-dependent oxidoreductase (luciferase family)